MLKTTPLVITISHEFGSGGAYLGQKIAKKLNILYVDRQIINLAAQKLNILADEVTSGDERPTSFLQSLSRYCAFISVYGSQPIPVTNHQIYDAQAEIILEIYKEKSVVIMGRCSSYILRNHPRHASILLHADISYRQKRIQQIKNISKQEALKLVKSTDKTRALYIHEITGLNL